MTQKNIYLYIPNLIGKTIYFIKGYFRVFCTILFCFTGRFYPVFSFFLYALAMICDLFDGMAARKFNQTSTFGAVLDMVTDRASNACLLAVLYALYPQIGSIFLVMLTLDLVSHWYQMYSTLYCNEKHHKNAVSEYRILEIYYKTPYVLFMMCFSSEAAMLNFYIYAFQGDFNSTFYNLNSYLAILFVPCLFLKHVKIYIQYNNLR